MVEMCGRKGIVCVDELSCVGGKKVDWLKRKMRKVRLWIGGG